MTLDALTDAGLVALSDVAGDPTWLREQRLSALARTRDQAWPDSRRDEFWRSTPFTKRFDVHVPIVGAEAQSNEPATPPASVVEDLEVEAALARVVDGRLVEVLLPAAMHAAGVIVTDLATAARDHEDLVRPHLGALTTSGSGSGADDDRTITVSDAAWTGGVFVHVPAEVELSAPISVHVHATAPGAHLPRVLAVIGHHASASLYLEHTSSGIDHPTLVNEVVEIVAQDASRVQVASLQEWGDEVAHLSLQKAAVHRDAEVAHLSVTTGGATVRLRPEFDLLGPGGRVRPLGIYFADEGQWFDLQPYVRHLAPRASSDVLFKGALQGRSRTVFRGNVFVHRDAVGTDTDENNRTLILTEGARADATPFLEIECSDITAGHGSATGQIDARYLYYLQSRGIRRADALRLIVHGFFREVLSEIDLPGIEARAAAHIEREIANADLEAITIDDAALRERDEEE